MQEKGIDLTTLRFYIEKHLDARSYPEEVGKEGISLSQNLFKAVSQAFIRKPRQEVTNLDLLNEIWNVPPTPAREYYAVSAIELCLTQNMETIRNCARMSFVFGPTGLANNSQPGQNYEGAFPPSYNVEVKPSNIAKMEDSRIFKEVEFCTNLTSLAHKKMIDPVFGRDQEIDRMTEVISRRKKNNPILLGEPGVGKTAVVEALAVRIIEGEVPYLLRSAEIIALDIARFIAGTRQRGDFEQRITNLVETLEANSNLILFVDEIHALVGGTLGASDAAELLKPALSSGRIRVIGATTHGEYLKYFGRNPAMARRFQPISIAEPDVDHAIMIIDKVIPTYAKFHNLTYCENASRLAVELSKSFIVDKQLPDKAIDVIDEAGASAAASGRNTVEDADFYKVVQRMSGIKLAVTENFGATVLEDLNKSILGQTEACSHIARALARSNSGLNREDRAKTAILLYGPESSGKRYAARQVANILNTKMIRIDMSEFVESHSTSRLIGAPPGYIGYGEGGQLTEAVRRNPSSVIFLDRMDLAHPNVTSIILQAIENGIITDSMGNNVSFTGTTVIMSIAYENVRKTIGFGANKNEEYNERPDGVPSSLLDAADVAVEFKPMPEVALETVASKLISELVKRLSKKDVKITIEGDVSHELARVAKEDVGTAKAVEIAFKKLIEDTILDALPKRGQQLALNIVDKKPVLEFIN
jgi:ATP-dependent Clp protease ATP-binding subunit ClpA